jgi:glycosyltransferase involved in cell wall biosynthesis
MAIFAGWDLDGFDIAFPHIDAKVVTPKDLAGMFRQSDASLVLSLTNLSLMPLEVMACGSPLVINRGPNNEWLIDESMAWFCDLTVESIVEALLAALDGGPQVEARRQRGIEVSRATSWDREFERFSGYLKGFG